MSSRLFRVTGNDLGNQRAKQTTPRYPKPAILDGKKVKKEKQRKKNRQDANAMNPFSAKKEKELCIKPLANCVLRAELKGIEAK